jgi:hypothetical protein
MPSESVREQIVAALVSALGGMTTAGGYSSDVANVYRWAFPAETALSFPAIAVSDLSETLDRRTRETYNRRLRLTIVAIDRIAYGENPDPGTIANRLLADVERCVESASTLAALGAIPGWIALRLVSSSSAIGVPSDPFCTVESVVEIDYRTTRADPSDGNP